MLVAQARLVLDGFDVPSRLEHVRRYVWRDGTLRFVVDDGQACYQLEAHWPAAVLEPIASAAGLELSDAPVVEGKWVRGTAGYVLRVGIDLAVPSAIYVRGDRLHSYVPFRGRPSDQVEQALQNDLTTYVHAFLSARRPVPEARAADARQLRRIAISVAPPSQVNGQH
jgi:hypothetical protein